MHASLPTIVVIAAGGAIGAVARHFVGGRVMVALGLPGFPWGTLTVNVVGALLMGAIVELAALRLSLSDPMRAFLTVGLLGGFTTFSAFSLEVALLMQKNLHLQAFLYVLASVLLTVAAVFAGLYLVRLVLT